MGERGPERSRGEGRLALGLALLAGLRVLVFCAALPFFTHVDEHRHVDAVLKYARGYLPRPHASAYEPRMGMLLGTYGSPEYHLAPGRSAPPPAWRAPRDEWLARIQAQEDFLAPRHNLEAYEAPLYYALAAAWLRLGSALGAQGAQLLYWVRSLNALAAFLLSLGASRLLRDVYPSNRFLRLGVPILLVVFPQDAVYYVTRDALSPLLGGLGFLWIARLARRPGSGAAFAAAGLLAAAAFLVKYTNAALLAAGALCTGRCVLRAPAGSGELRSPAARCARPSAACGRVPLRRIALAWGCALVPIGIWLVRNQLLFGDWLGSGFKVERMGWGVKPLSQVTDHPLFTLSGLASFVSELIPTFWRGQLAWHRTTLAWSSADRAYTLSTLLFLVCAAAGLRRRDPAGARLEEALALFCLIFSAALLAALSLPFVFHETSDPSARHPFFSHGRLVSGMLVPFLIAYLRGIQVAASAFGSLAGVAAWLCLAALLALVSVSEIALSLDVFRSPYNWFHLP